MKAAELLVKCLENEGVDYIFGLPGRGEHRRDGCAARQPHPLHHHAPRAGRGLHGRRLRPAHGQGGRVPVHARPRRDQSDHRRGRRQHGPRAGGRDRRPRRHHADAQGEPPDSRSGATCSIRSPSTRRRSASRRSCRRSCARPSRWRRRKSPARPSSTFPRTSPRAWSTKQPIEVQTAYTSAPPEFKIEEAARIISRAKCPVDPGRQRRHPAGRDRFAGELRRGAAHPGGQHLHGEGRDAVLERAVARHDRLEGTRPAVVRVRARRMS